MLEAKKSEMCVTEAESKSHRAADCKICEQCLLTDPGFLISSELEQESKKIDSQDFQIEKLLGRSPCGKVTLVRHNKDGTVYALKTLSKKSLVKAAMVDHTKTERRQAAGVTLDKDTGEDRASVHRFAALCVPDRAETLHGTRD